MCDKARDKRVTKLGAMCDIFFARHNRVTSGGPKSVRDTVRDRVRDKARDKRVTKNRAVCCSRFRTILVVTHPWDRLSHTWVGPPKTTCKAMCHAPGGSVCHAHAGGGGVLSRTRWGGSVCHAHAGGFCHTHTLGSTRPLEKQMTICTNDRNSRTLNRPR